MRVATAIRDKLTAAFAPVALEVRDERYELGLRDVVRHRECLVAHQAVAAFRVPGPREPVVAPALGPGGDPAVYVLFFDGMLQMDTMPSCEFCSSCRPFLAG